MESEGEDCRSSKVNKRLNTSEISQSTRKHMTCLKSRHRNGEVMWETNLLHKFSQTPHKKLQETKPLWDFWIRIKTSSDTAKVEPLNYQEERGWGGETAMWEDKGMRRKRALLGSQISGCWKKNLQKSCVCALVCVCVSLWLSHGYLQPSQTLGTVCIEFTQSALGSKKKNWNETVSGTHF